jgi:hypothetical protein
VSYIVRSAKGYFTPSLNWATGKQWEALRFARRDQAVGVAILLRWSGWETVRVLSLRRAPKPFVPSAEAP